MSNILVQEFGARLRLARMNYDMSVKCLAWALQVTPHVVHNWETGRCLPNPKTMNELAQTLNVDLAWLSSGMVRKTVAAEMALHDALEMMAWAATHHELDRIRGMK